MELKYPKNYGKRSLTARMLATISPNIYVYIPAPFESVIYNKYYLMLCRHLDPDTNIVCVMNDSRYVPVNTKEALMMYLSILSPISYKRFINACFEINLMMIIEAFNDKVYYVINPVFACHKILNFQSISKFFSLVSSFGMDLVIDEKYVKDVIKPQSDDRIAKW